MPLFLFWENIRKIFHFFLVDFIGADYLLLGWRKGVFEVSYRVVCSKGNVTDIVFMCESYEDAIERIMVNLNEIILDYFDLVRKYESNKDFGLIKGIVYDKEAIYEMLEWKIYES